MTRRSVFGFIFIGTFIFLIGEGFASSLLNVWPAPFVKRRFINLIFILLGPLAFFITLKKESIKKYWHEIETSSPAHTLESKFSKCSVVKYIKEIYAVPLSSEFVLGKFFLWKTILTTAIAFYAQDILIYISIITFCALFDSATGFYQHTLMNYFHKTLFKNKFLIFCQNLVKRFLVDILRAEVITFLILGFNFIGVENQLHVVVNRLASGSYYFTAILIDRLVAMNTISRKFRAQFIIFASSVGGLLCILHLAKTRMPEWMPLSVINSIPAWMPGPLGILMIFNIGLFVIFLIMYLINVFKNKKALSEVSNSQA